MTDTTPEIEAVAKAIYVADFSPEASPMTWADAPKGTKQHSIKMARAAIAAMPGWQPIETAPTKGRIMLHRPTSGMSEPDIGDFDNDCYAKKPRPYWSSERRWMGVSWCRTHTPTHWMPLPKPPKDDK